VTGFLHDPKRLALSLLCPWLSTVLITPEDCDKGLFANLVSHTFGNLHLAEELVPCWASLAAYTQVPAGNVPTVMTYLLAALARCPQVTVLATEIATAMYAAHPQATLAPIVSQLSDQGFDWRRPPVLILISPYSLQQSICFIFSFFLSFYLCCRASSSRGRKLPPSRYSSWFTQILLQFRLGRYLMMHFVRPPQG